MGVKLLKVLILGAPASGKGTISSRIVNAFNLNHISCGDKLRQHINNKTDIGSEAAKYTSTGKLVPDDLMIKFICEELVQAGPAWLLDGFPRTVSQAESLSNKHKLDVALNLNVPYSVIIERVKNRWVHLASGRVYNLGFNSPKTPGKDDITGEPLVKRDDDKPDIVRKRLEQYEQLTRPVIEYYRKLGILEEFSGKTSDEIWPKVLAYLTDYTKQNRYNL